MGLPRTVVRASAFAELDGKRRRQSIYPGSGPRDRVTALRPVGVSPLHWIDVYDRLLCVVLLVVVTGVRPRPALYRSGEQGGSFSPSRITDKSSLSYLQITILFLKSD
jgi:hypothetical protein